MAPMTIQAIREFGCSILSPFPLSSSPRNRMMAGWTILGASGECDLREASHEATLLLEIVTRQCRGAPRFRNWGSHAVEEKALRATGAQGQEGCGSLSSN